MLNEGKDVSKENSGVSSTEYKQNPYFINEEELNPKEVVDGLRESYILSQPKMVSVWNTVIICILVAFIVFFGQRNYLKGELINQAKMIAEQQTVIQRQGLALERTASVIDQVTWPKKVADAWREIGYKVNN